MNSKISNNYTKIAGTNIHYLSAGEGEVILLLHGWPTSSYLWRNIMDILCDNYRVIAIDLPGFGKSDKKPEDSYSFRYYSRIIDGFLDNLEIENITLGVHDLGGPIGLYWMVQNMNRVDRLILLNTLIYPEFSWAVKLFGISTFLPVIREWITSPGGIKKAIRFGVNNKEKLSEEVIQNYQDPYKDKASRKALLMSVQRLSIKGYREISEKLSSYHGAVQVIYGVKDRILPNVGKTMQRLKSDLPQTKIFTLPHCGHFIQEEEPQKIAELMRDFMIKNEVDD